MGLFSRSKPEPQPARLPARGPVNDRYANPSYQQPQGYPNNDPRSVNPSPAQYAPNYDSRQPNPAYTQRQPVNAPKSAYAAGPPLSSSQYGGNTTQYRPSRYASADNNRSELFSGVPNDNNEQAPNRYVNLDVRSDGSAARRAQRYNPDGTDRFANSTGELDENGQEDLEELKTYTRGVKEDSLQSTRETLRIITETQEIARGTLVSLGDQSDHIAETERALDESRAFTTRAKDKVGEINLLNKSIFNPLAYAQLNLKQDNKRLQAETKMRIRHDEEEALRIAAMNDAEASRRGLAKAMTSASGRSGQGSAPVSYRQQAVAARQKQQSQYQFESTHSDDEIEDEINDNVNQIGNAVSNLKLLAGAMGTEIKSQTERLSKVTDKAIGADLAMRETTDRMRRI